MLMSVYKKTKLPHVRLQQANKHDVIKLCLIKQIYMQFVFMIQIPLGNVHKAKLQQLKYVCY